MSVKQGNEHGLGIRRVKELVEKADGVLQITSDNKIFSDVYTRQSLYNANT